MAIQNRISGIAAIAGALGAFLSILALSGAGRAEPAGKAVGRLQFNRDVRPILSDNCFACHGPDQKKRQANLRLDQGQAVRARGIIVPGRPEKSALIARVNAVGTPVQMPPESFRKSLTTAQRVLLARWVKEGAEFQEHWSYIPPRRPPVPASPSSLPGGQRGADRLFIARWSANPIDRFILQKLVSKGLRPAAEADRRTLLRRVYLDLIGIPPTPAEMDAWLADRKPGAFERVVDRLVASPRFGERMAVPWLDEVRYADTVGYHGDQNMNAWAYRDYVIDSFNANKPFDQFTREQIAGDLLPQPTIESRIATCFNRLNMVTREGGAQPGEYLAKYQADRVRTIGLAWLGSTLACCECHDHKFDPFTARDFYSLAAFFADIKQWGVYQDYGYTPNPDLRGWSNDHPFPPEIVVESPYLKQRIGRLQEQQRKAAASVDVAAHGAEFQSWRAEAAAFHSANPRGWAALQPTVVAGVDGKPLREPAAAARADGGFDLADSSPQDIRLGLSPAPGWVAAIRMELLTGRNGSILRTAGGPGTLVPAMALVRKDGSSQALGFRYASAPYHEPRYYNGFDILGQQRGWRLAVQHTKQSNDSLWILETPVRLADGDSLSLTLRGVRLAAMRLSVSPFLPDSPDSPAFSPALGKSLEAADNAETEPEALCAWVAGTAADAAAFARIKELEREIAECRGGVTPVMVVESVKPFVTRVLPRGNWQDERGAVVQPAVPHFLPQPKQAASRPLNRLDLAEWLCSPVNPLTSRVFVNRLWRQFFGAGLSDSVEDLGAQGEWPSHPDLLDWLACEFMKPQVQAIGHSGIQDAPDTRTPERLNTRTPERLNTRTPERLNTRTPEHPNSRPWDIKHIVRLIVTSQTYRQSSQSTPQQRRIDPANRLLASQNPRRLDAEFVRDNALAVAGLLNTDMGGPPCMPYQPAGYYANLQFPDREYQPDKNDRQWRRGVYTHWQRTFLHPMLANFGAPSREDCTAFRPQANTPQQALTLLNDPEFTEAARALARALLRSPAPSGAAGDAARIDLAYQRAIGRSPAPRERQSLLGFLLHAREEFRQRPDDAKKVVAIGYSQPSGDADVVEAAAWSTLCRVVLNLHETITRY